MKRENGRGKNITLKFLTAGTENLLASIFWTKICTKVKHYGKGRFPADTTDFFSFDAYSRSQKWKCKVCDGFCNVQQLANIMIIELFRFYEKTMFPCFPYRSCDSSSSHIRKSWPNGDKKELNLRGK